MAHIAGVTATKQARQHQQGFCEQATPTGVQSSFLGKQTASGAVFGEPHRWEAAPLCELNTII
jgi:hypothetical protein